MSRFIIATLLAFGLFGFVSSEEEKRDAKPAGEKVERLHADQWCFVHDLPKAKDTLCDKTLIPKLKKEGDWCKEHAFPESVCAKCNPKEVKEYLDARRPDSKEWPKDWKPGDAAKK